MSKSNPIKLTHDSEAKLQQWAKAHGTPQQVVKRCRLVLLMAEGVSALRASQLIGTNRHTAELWRARFLKHGPDTHWSTREMARSEGVHHSTVARVWQDHELKPHRHRTFKLSRDPNYAAKLIDVVGVYLSPPEHAVVLCIDEKSQIQALDRTQPGLPLKPGRCGTWTHDYVRHGTTTLFAALEAAKGKVTGQCYARHRHQEFLKFLRHIDTEYDGGEELHLILDNYCTHKHQKVRLWLEKHPRFKLHFIPTSSSWLNLVERWFAELTNKAVRRGSFANVPDLVSAIEEFIQESSKAGKPFVWKATAERLLAKYERCRSRLEEISPGCTAPRRKRKTAV